MSAQEIHVQKTRGPGAGDAEVEIVERKGLAHPDTICDLVMERDLPGPFAGLLGALRRRPAPQLRQGAFGVVFKAALFAHPEKKVSHVRIGENRATMVVGLFKRRKAMARGLQYAGSDGVKWRTVKLLQPHEWETRPKRRLRLEKNDSEGGT